MTKIHLMTYYHNFVHIYIHWKKSIQHWYKAFSHEELVFLSTRRATQEAFKDLNLDSISTIPIPPCSGLPIKVFLIVQIHLLRFWNTFCTYNINIHNISSEPIAGGSEDIGFSSFICYEETLGATFLQLTAFRTFVQNIFAKGGFNVKLIIRGYDVLLLTDN